MRESGHLDEDREMLIRWQEFKDDARKRGVTGEVPSSNISESPSRLN